MHYCRSLSSIVASAGSRGCSRLELTCSPVQIRPDDPLATSLYRLGKDRRNLREEGIDLKRLGDDGDAAGSMRTLKVIARSRERRVL
jgi:hypothetical protein